MNILPEMKFTAHVWQWRGPAPFYFVTVPDSESAEIKDVSKMLTYGWGMIPVTVTVGKTTVKTSLFLKNGNYVVPLKAILREAENISEGGEVTIRMNFK